MMIGQGQVKPIDAIALVKEGINHLGRSIGLCAALRDREFEHELETQRLKGNKVLQLKEREETRIEKEELLK